MNEDEKRTAREELVDHIAEVCDYDTAAMREVADRVKVEADAIDEANTPGDE